MALLCQFKTLAEYAELRKWLEGLLQAGRTSDWGDAVRDLIENDLFYLLSEVLSDGKLEHSTTGERFYWNQVYVDMCRGVEWQISQGGGIDVSGRGSGKSTVRTKAGNIQRMVKYPNSTGCIFSYQRRSSLKHFLKIKEELETNTILRTVCDDVFFWDPKNSAKIGETTWSKNEGLRVKRRGGVVYGEHTLEYNAFIDGTPTGGRFDWLDFDDVEDYKALGSEEMVAKLHKSYDTSLFVLTEREIKPAVMMFTNTIYDEGGLANRVLKKFEDTDPSRIRRRPGENLEERGDGPMGGTAQYPFTNETLYKWYQELEDPREYATQICCSFNAGADRRFAEDWLLFYNEQPERVARTCNIYICIDPSRGRNDPTVIFVWGLGPDKKFKCLDISLRFLDPALPEFIEEIVRMVGKWKNLGKRLVEIRVEQFGQSTFAELIAAGLQNHGYYEVILPCADNMRTGRFSSGKKDREFERWARPAKDGEVMFPLPLKKGGIGIVREYKKRGEATGKSTDLVQYFLDKEWNPFPGTVTDNILDAGSLIWEPVERTQSPLQFAAFGGFRRQQYSRGTTAMSMG